MAEAVVHARGSDASDHRPTAREGETDERGGIAAHAPQAKVVGLIALIASVVYFVSDAIEVVQGGFSGGQLWLTLMAEAAVPVFVVGLMLVQRPFLGRVGAVSAVAYAYSYVFFTATVVYALVDGTEDYAALRDELGVPMTAHGAVMVLAGLGFGYAVLRARLLPAWTGVALMAGVVLVSLAQALPDGVQLAAAGIRASAFAGMGAALLTARRRSVRDQRRPLPVNGRSHDAEAAMRMTKAALATGFVAAIVVAYAAYVALGGLPFIEDVRGMAAVGLLFGFASRRIGGREGFKHQRAAFIAGLASMALGVTALATESEAVLALFIASIVVLWAAATYIRSGRNHLRHVGMSH